MVGTSGTPAISQFPDRDTGEVLDDADWYDRLEELAEIKVEESSETEGEAAE